MTDQEITQAREDLQQLDIEQLRCGVMLQLLKIEALTKERDALTLGIDQWRVDYHELRLEHDKLMSAAKLALDALEMAQNNLASSRAMLGRYTTKWDTYGTAIDTLRQAGVQ